MDLLIETEKRTTLDVERVLILFIFFTRRHAQAISLGQRKLKLDKSPSHIYFRHALDVYIQGVSKL